MPSNRETGIQNRPLVSQRYCECVRTSPCTNLCRTTNSSYVYLVVRLSFLSTFLGGRSVFLATWIGPTNLTYVSRRTW